MPVIPCNIQRIPANGLYFLRPGWFLVHGQQRSCRLLFSLARLATLIVALFGAGCARARIPQPLEPVVGSVAVIPLNIHSRSCGHIDLHRFWVRHRHIFQYIGWAAPLRHTAKHLIANSYSAAINKFTLKLLDTSTTRQPGLDLMRGLAIVWVMLFHFRFISGVPH